MAISLNGRGRSNATELVASGNVDKTSKWSMSADDENKILGDPPDWNGYAKWFLGIDSGADSNTKDHYKYPFGKNGKVYRSALVAIRQRAGQQNATDIFNAAGTLIDRIDGKSEQKSAGDSREMRTVEMNMTVETRADGKKMLRGHAAVFNQETVIGRWFREMILPGAFVDTIQQDDQRALFNHDPNFVLGRKSSGTLELAEDSHGLAITIDPPDTQLIRDLVVAPIERGDITQMSFTFAINGSSGEEWESGEEGMIDLRKIKSCRVFDVSPVTFPAYEGTDIALRSQETWREELRAAKENESRSAEKEEARRIDIENRRKRLALKEKEAI